MAARERPDAADLSTASTSASSAASALGLSRGMSHPCAVSFGKCLKLRRCQPVDGSIRGPTAGLGAIVLAQRGRLFHAARSYEEVLKMPTFSIVSLSEAREGSARGKRAELLQEYIGYTQRVSQGEAGVLEPGEGETPQAIRRRLNAAAANAGEEIGHTPLGQDRLLLAVRGASQGQAAQKPG